MTVKNVTTIQSLNPLKSQIRTWWKYTLLHSDFERSHGTGIKLLSSADITIVQSLKDGIWQWPKKNNSFLLSQLNELILHRLAFQLHDFSWKSKTIQQQNYITVFTLHSCLSKLHSVVIIMSSTVLTAEQNAEYQRPLYTFIQN